MSDGILKAEKDFSKEADKILPEAESIAKVRGGAAEAKTFVTDPH